MVEVEKVWLNFYDNETPKSIKYPHYPIYELLDRSAQKYPDNILTIFYGNTLTYKQIKEFSDSLAYNLKKRGLRNGDRVALLLPNFPGYIISYYGILKANCTVVPLNPLYTENELNYQVSDSKAKLIITIPQFAKKALSISENLQLKKPIVSYVSDFLPFPLKIIMRFKENKQLKGIKNKVENMKNLMYSKGKFTKEETDPHSLGVLIYSGGTTGVAKGIMLSHFAVVANVHQISSWGHLKPDDRILAVLPMFHGYGMNVCMNSAIFNGMSIILMPRFNAKEMAKNIQKHKPTMTAVVPTILTALSNLPNIEKYDFTSLKAVWVGAAPLTKAIKENFENKAKCKVIEGYGLTEAVTAIMANPYLGKQKIGSIGLPFPDVDAKIVSLEDGKTELKPNEIGEIVLKTPTLMLGYLNKKKETEETIRDGWLYTGDIGYMDEEGYFYITDRKKDLIIVGGFNVFPSEIDEVLYMHPKVKEGITVGIPDDYKGEKIKVYIVLKDGETATEDEFREFFRKHLVPYKVPSEIEFRDSLPKSAIGKILRKKLREEEIQKRNNVSH